MVDATPVPDPLLGRTTVTGIGLLSCMLFAGPLWSQVPEIPRSTVGMPVEISDLVLPGSQLETAPITDETPVVVRIDAVHPHGTEFRYDLVCYTLEPGEFNVADYLQRKDGSTTDGLPELLLSSESLLPAGQIEPHGLTPRSLPWLGGYRLALVLAGIAWVIGLVWILYPKRKSTETESESSAEPTSLADRLRPLVVEAVEGRAEPVRLAELERALVRYWRRRLQLEDLTAAEALSRLREHEEAGALMTQLEVWLHRPASDATIDINNLLAPYRDVSPDDLPLRPNDVEASTTASHVTQGAAP